MRRTLGSALVGIGLLVGCGGTAEAPQPDAPVAEEAARAQPADVEEAPAAAEVCCQTVAAGVATFTRMADGACTEAGGQVASDAAQCEDAPDGGEIPQPKPAQKQVTKPG